MSATDRLLVVCVGNMLLLDEGLGPYVARVLTDKTAALKHFDEEHADILMKSFRVYQEESDPEDKRIPVLDAGTMGMSLIPYIKKYDRMVIVDVIDMGQTSGVAPGTVYILKPQDMAEHTIMHTLHDLRVVDVIANAQLAGYNCDINCVCMSVNKKDIDPKDFTIDLTQPVKDAIPTLIGALLSACGLEI